LRDLILVNEVMRQVLPELDWLAHKM